MTKQFWTYINHAILCNEIISLIVFEKYRRVDILPVVTLIMTQEIEKLDVIIFGATGFTGKSTVYEACNVLTGLKWGVAGRSHSKLEATLKKIGQKANKDLTATPIIVADVNDAASCEEMTRRCRIVVNCCGPYRSIGEPVVRACIDAGTHHVDLSGESNYMELMQLKYHKEAQERGVYIVSACGFDSIPSEMGLVYLEQNFNGVVNSVETFLKFWLEGNKKIDGAQLHYGTWQTGVEALASVQELMEVHSKLFPEKLPTFKPEIKSRWSIARSEVTDNFCVPFPSPDLAVVERSQRMLYEMENKRPVQIKAYLTVTSRFSAFLLILFGAFFVLMAKFRLGRKILLKYPKECSFGYFSHEGPTDDYIENSRFAMYIKGRGWPSSERLAPPTDEYEFPPNKSLVVRISGRNFAYGAACVSVLCCATTILKEGDKIPGKGGVLPPAVAFAKTSLISEMGKYERGLKFEVVN